MSNIKELLDYEIYPALYSNIVNALPEFKFKRTARGYISTTDLKITGDKGKAGKVYIYDNNINRLIDYTRGAVSLWDYIQGRDKLNTNKDVLMRLAELSGVTLPKNNYNAEEYNKHRQKAQLWEDVNTHLVFCLKKLLETAFSTAKHPKAKALQKYLNERGYTSNDIEAMELGFMPTWNKLKKHLKDKGYTENELNNIKLHTAIGETHTLTIPLREPVGNIIGITVRNIKYKEGDKTGKYINSTGLEKTDKLFNLRALKGRKNIVIVEGLLDSLLASARGIENVVALGGKGFNEAQLKTAIKYGAQKITLCYDNEEETIPNILKAIQLIKENSDLKIYVAQLPEKIKDADELIIKNGTEAFTTVLEEAIPHYEYELKHIINNYYKLQERKGELSAEDEDNFLEDVVVLASGVREPIDKDRLIKTFLSQPEIKELGISQSSLEATIDKISFRKDKEKQSRQLKYLLDEAHNLQEKGDTVGALDILQTKTRELKAISKRATFDSLLIPVAETEMRERLKDKPLSLNSGFILKKDEELLLPAGAITIFSAPTSHCKTTMLINLALNTSQIYKDYQFHLFSYEEDRDTVILKALNTYVNENLSHNNLKSLKSYYSQPEDEAFTYFKRTGDSSIKSFTEKKEKFFKEFIDTQRLNIHYVDYDSDTLVEAIEYLSKKAPVGAVYIDYMQLLRKGNKSKYNSRQEELKQVCLDLKDVAVNTGLPIILGAQFNREVINHAKIHPTNIGEAGDIERVANTIIGLWNNNFKPVDFKQDEKKHFEGYIKDNSIYGKVLKMREGRVDTEFLLDFTGNTGKIKSNDYEF